MSRIDHTAAALAALDAAYGSVSATNIAAIEVTAAKVHATLAQVEQQRIANLLALSLIAGNEQVGEYLAEAAFGALDHVIDMKIIPNGQCEPDEVSVLSDDVAAALGITS